MTAIQAINELLKNLIEHAKPGVNLLELEQQAKTLLDIYGATPLNLNYQPKHHNVPFPSVICLSINDTVAHGIPYNYTLQDGDLLTIDCGLRVDNMASDAGLTVGIGNLSSRDKRLLRYTRRALRAGIEKIHPGIPITAVGREIEWFAKQNGFVVNKNLAGHGIGYEMHEAPTIPMYDFEYHFKSTDNIPVFKEGQIVCIEPHLTYKDEYGKLESDGWTVKTRDGRKSAMAEHMVEVTSYGCRILTNHIPIG